MTHLDSPPIFLTDQQTNSPIIVASPRTLLYTTIDLNCTVYGDPPPELIIAKDGRELLTETKIEPLPSGDFFAHYPIQLASIHDAGLYECIATNSFGSSSLSKHVNIEGQMPLIQPLDNLTVSSGREFTLACYASGHPNLHLQWIDETTNQIVNTSVTSPIQLTSSDTVSKVYTCQATNSFGQTSSQVFLDLQTPAKILSVTANRTIRINATLPLHCLAEGDDVLELMIRTPFGRKIETIEAQSGNRRNLSITINNIQMSDSGVYECRAKNKHSTDRSVFAILVQNVPSRIENIFVENLERIFWMKPFDGHATISHYLLHMRFKQSKRSDFLRSTMTLVFQP